MKEAIKALSNIAQRDNQTDRTDNKLIDRRKELIARILKQRNWVGIWHFLVEVSPVCLTAGEDNMKKEIQNEIKMYQARDWEIKEDLPTHVVLEKNTATLAGHLIVFFLTAWFTLGIGNLVYWLMSKKTKKVIKWKKT